MFDNDEMRPDDWVHTLDISTGIDPVFATGVTTRDVTDDPATTLAAG